MGMGDLSFLWAYMRSLHHSPPQRLFPGYRRAAYQRALRCAGKKEYFAIDAYGKYPAGADVNTTSREFTSR